MKNLIINIINKIFVRSGLYTIKRNILLRMNFKIIKKVGKGKDGTTFLVKDKKNDKFILKVLSTYGKQYLSITKKFVEKNIQSKHLYKLKLLSDDLILYPYEKLDLVKTDTKNFPMYLKQICDLEIGLIRHGLCWWDFGFINHCNYMVNKEGDIKVIDYGGNSFLTLSKNSSISVNNHRKNLVFASNNYLKLQFLFHIYYYGLGRRTKELLPSLAQNWNEGRLTQYINFCVNEMKDTIYGSIVKAISKNNLLSVDGWADLKKVITALITTKKFNNLQESADISGIRYLKNKIEIRGYQSYDITNKEIIPISSDGKSLWDTEQKFKLVEMSLNKIIKQDKIKSFLDIGSNLGLYVFFGKLKYKIDKCIGIDYNQKYIDVCNKIVNRLVIKGCFFEKRKFSEINDKYDCVLAIGIIHHLFHRTEGYGSLKVIMRSFSDIVNKYLIIEFPTEKDVKAKKWTNIPGRVKEEKYNLKNFLKYSKIYFSKTEKIGNINNTRITFLLTK